MADVDLRVEVTSVGVSNAIAQMENLRTRGLNTTSALNGLATASSAVMKEITNASTATGQAVQKMTDYGRAMKEAGRATSTLNRELDRQEKQYRSLARLDPASTARERLARAGGLQGIAGGMALALALENRQLSRNASLIRDRQTVLREEAALDSARAGRTSANAALERQRWEAGLHGMKAHERQLALVTRAEQELLIAQRALNASMIQVRGAGGKFLPYTPEQVRGQTQAINELARAEAALHRARTDEGGENAFQSSYSYFILAGLATQAAQAIFGVAEASLTATAAIERSFADTERTFEGTDAQLASLQDRLISLSTQTPISVLDLAQIATLGNQLGVASEDIESFTSVIAQYTAVSGESAEMAATAFGRISNLTGLAASQYENLASAITYTARTTVATESTIQNTAKEISALAAGAGFSAQSIVGLAGALSSLAIPPERARGALSLYFGALNSAVAEGGPKMQAFAELTNLTADQLGRMVRENRGQEVFQAFIAGLSELDTVAKTTALDTLGLSTIRVDQTMRALAQNVPLVTQAFNGANQAFAENTEIATQYAIIQETLDSKWKEFQNSIQNAAGELGESFAPAAQAALELLTDLLVTASEIADSPLGRSFLTFASGASVLIGVLAAAVGAAALAKASLVVLSFAVRQLGWSAATKGIMGWIAALVSTNPVNRAAALSATGLRVAVAETTDGMTLAAARTRAWAVALTVLKVALPIVAITAAIALFDQMHGKIEKLIDPSKRLTDDLSGLVDALKADNPDALVRAVDNLGTAAQRTSGAPISDFNASLLAAIEMQRRAEGQFNSTSGAIDSQAFALGETSKAWIAEALKTQEAIADIIDGSDWWETLMETIFQPGSADEITSRENFEKLILGGLDLNEISQIAITQGKDAAMAAYDAWQKGYQEANPGEIDSVTFESLVLPGILDSVIDAYGKAAVQAALAGNAIDQTGGVAVAVASDFDQLGNYIGDAIDSGEALQVTFSGVTGTLAQFRDSIQSAIAGTVGFDSVLDRAEAAADAIAKAAGEDVAPKPVNARMFGASLNDAVDDALKFYSDLMTLAEGGNQSFALQLAELGPEAQGILSSALSLDAASQAELEASARFAAFLASDAFKETLEAQMSESNQAYARVFRETGDLGLVQDIIAAEIAGPEAIAKLEKEWLLAHPDLPLNITPNLVNPTDEEIAMFGQELSGRLTITPKITHASPGSGGTYAGANVYTDNQTGASIELPATLSGPALSKSLELWQENQNLTPEQIAAKLNTEGFDEDIDAWVKANGPIRVNATIVPIHIDTSSGLVYTGRKTRGGEFAQGGEVDLPRFASGGYGMFRGPGSGTSDSFTARVSNGEYINTADSTSFWGPDFFDSLNKKMLPTSFLNVLGAAVSGNRGPTHVAHVSVVQQNPLTRDPLKQLRESSEDLAAGIWG